LNDLDAFISTGVSKRITSKDNFAEYCRKFRIITDHLIKEGRMSELELKKMFLKGLHEDFQASIVCQMEILKPAHPSGMPWEIDDMIEADNTSLTPWNQRSANRQTLCSSKRR
jgi:hypothetical protein